MGKSIQLGIIGLGLALPALPGVSLAQTVSFHDASNGFIPVAGTTSFYNALYYGQGAAADPGHNVWNGFGNYDGPGSTGFYGPSNPDSGSNQAVPNGNVGSPYAWYTIGNGAGTYTGHTSTGNTLFSPTNFGAANPGNATSAGLLSTVTFTIGAGYIGDNGGGGLKQGTSGFLLGTAALTTSTAAFTLGGVPRGSYNLFLYGANYDGDRGAVFTVATANGGTPLGGFTSAMNTGTANGSTQTTYVLGANYVEFLGVTPDINGNINGTWGAIANTITGQTGEGDFNGLQLQAVPEPRTWITLLGAAVGGLFVRAFRRRKMAG